MFSKTVGPVTGWIVVCVSIVSAHQGVCVCRRDFGEAASKLTDALNLDLLFGLRLQFIMDRAVCYLRTFQDGNHSQHR